MVVVRDMKLSSAKKNNNLIYFVFITIVLTIILLSNGFSAFQNDLSIGDVSATVQVDKDIRVMGISDALIDNDNLKFEILDYNLKDKICENNQCSLGIEKTFKI